MAGVESVSSWKLLSHEDDKIGEVNLKDGINAIRSNETTISSRTIVEC